MAKLIAFETSHGQMLVAVPKSGETITAVGLVDDAIQKVQDSLDDVLLVLAGVNDSIRAALEKAKHPPSMAEVEFGLQFTAKGNVYVVATESAASVKITLTHKFD